MFFGKPLFFFISIQKGRKPVMKYFDAHIHFFPDNLAEKALTRLSQVCGCPYYTGGTREDTVKKLTAWGCEGGMAYHIATNQKQQSSVNLFASQSQEGNIYCFGSVFPGAENALEELHRMKELGLHGVKLHPDYQEFLVKEEAAMAIYEEGEKLGLPMAFHTGRDPYSPQLVHCHPKSLGEIADCFPKLTIIAAHMGGMELPQEAAEYLAGKKNVYFDTAFASHFLNPQQLEELIRLHGPERVLFATDCPWSTVPAEKELLEATGLSAAEKEAIACRNAEELFEIQI